MTRSTARSRSYPARYRGGRHHGTTGRATCPASSPGCAEHLVGRLDKAAVPELSLGHAGGHEAAAHSPGLPVHHTRDVQLAGIAQPWPAHFGNRLLVEPNVLGQDLDVSVGLAFVVLAH